MNATEWRNRTPKVRVYDLCGECETLKEGVARHEFWTPTGKRVHTCCEACRKDLHRQYYTVYA